MIRGGQGRSDEEVRDTGNVTAILVVIGLVVLAAMLAGGW